jgi:hypothetical protein
MREPAGYGNMFMQALQKADGLQQPGGFSADSYT